MFLVAQRDKNEGLKGDIQKTTLPFLFPVFAKHFLSECCHIGLRYREYLVRSEELEFVASGIAGYLSDEVQIDEECSMDMKDEGIGRQCFFDVMERTTQTLLREVLP